MSKTNTKDIAFILLYSHNNRKRTKSNKSQRKKSQNRFHQPLGQYLIGQIFASNEKKMRKDLFGNKLL